MFQITKLDTAPIVEKIVSHTSKGRGKNKIVTEDVFEITYHEFSVTYGAETRILRATKGWTVEADGSVRWFLAHQFRAQLSGGNKAHRVGLTIEMRPDGSHVEYNTVVLNRQAAITGFWEAAYDAPQGYGSKHNGTYTGGKAL